MRLPLLLLFFVVSIFVGVNSDKLAVIMLDGFRWDYINKMSDDDVPNFKKFFSDGIRAEYVQPIFPSVSFPSWTTIATGTTSK